jgi:hypothetical protein
MALEKMMRLQLLGALIMFGRFFVAGFFLTGYYMAGLPAPALPPARGRSADTPSLTPGEWLTWTALEWRLARAGDRAPVLTAGSLPEAKLCPHAHLDTASLIRP